MNTTADDLAQKAWDLLQAAPTKPTGLTPDKILDFPLLPLDPENLPAIAVYVTEGDVPTGNESQLSVECTATLTVDIRCMADHPLKGTRLFREWVLKTLLPVSAPGMVPDDTFGGLALNTVYQGFKPYGDVKDQWEAGAYLTFEIHYLWRP